MYYGFMHNLHLPFKCIKKLELLMILIHFDDAALDVQIACYSTSHIILRPINLDVVCFVQIPSVTNSQLHIRLVFVQMEQKSA